MVELKRSIEYELRDFKDKRYIAHLNSARHYKIGDEIELPDFLIYQNNSQRFRACTIEKIEIGECSGIIRFYLMPTKKEFKPAGFLDWQKISKCNINGIDWSGSEWLDTSQFK